jgi:hypothetical protein
MPLERCLIERVVASNPSGYFVYQTNHEWRQEGNGWWEDNIYTTSFYCIFCLEHRSVKNKIR